MTAVSAFKPGTVKRTVLATVLHHRRTRSFLGLPKTGFKAAAQGLNPNGIALHGASAAFAAAPNPTNGSDILGASPPPLLLPPHQQGLNSKTPSASTRAPAPLGPPSFVAESVRRSRRSTRDRTGSCKTPEWHRRAASACRMTISPLRHRLDRAVSLLASITETSAAPAGEQHTQRRDRRRGTRHADGLNRIGRETPACEHGGCSIAETSNRCTPWLRRAAATGDSASEFASVPPE